MSPDIFFGAGDTAPLVTDTLFNPDGSGLDLAGATVVATYRDKDQVSGPVTEPVTITQTADPLTLGKIEWAPAGARVAGDYNLQWHATLASGKLVTVPNDRYLWVQVLPVP